MDENDIARLAARREGVVTSEQLRAAGLSYSQIATRVRHGYLHRRLNGVYDVGYPRDSLRAQRIRALEAAGPKAFLSGWTAAACRDIALADPSLVEVTIPAEHTPKRQPGVVFHRTTDLIPQEVTVVDGLRVATIPRIFIELAAPATDGQLVALLNETVRTGQMDSFALEAAIRRHVRRPGVGRLKQVADFYRPLPDRKSELERMFDRDVARRPEIPTCERNVMLGRWEIDCLWREHGVALELDGRRFHTAQRDAAKDRRKDTALQLMSLKPMRASYWMWVDDQESVIGDLLALLALGSLTKRPGLLAAATPAWGVAAA